MVDDIAKSSRIGPVILAPGIPVNEVIIFLFVAAMTSCIFSFVGIILPFVLSELAHVPFHEQGRTAGMLATIQQTVLMTCVGLTGALGDKVGRRFLLCCTLLGLAFCLTGISLVSGIVSLVVLWFVYGFISSLHTASVPPKFVEYPAEQSRGRFMALVMVSLNMSSIVLVGYVAARLPFWYQATGLSLLRAGQVSLWTAAIVAVLMAGIAWRFMMPDRAKVAPDSEAKTAPRRRFGGYAEVLRHARANPRFGLLVVSAFVIRTDDAVMGSFLALWVTISAKAQGIGMMDAMKIVGGLAMIKSAMHIVVPLIIGAVLDRVDRTRVYSLSIALVGASLMSTIFVRDITGYSIYIVVLFIGGAEAMQTIAQQALFGQEAPRHLRGTAYGMLAVMGSVSVVVVSMLGGFLFDKVGPAAPFLLSGGAHLLVLLLFGVLRLPILRSRRSPPVVEAR